MSATWMHYGVSTGEAARRLGVSTFTVREWLAAGKLSFTRTSLGALIDPLAVELLAEERAAAREGTREEHSASETAQEH